jgi:hypothetical protein
MRSPAPDVPLREIAGLRDVLIHHYFGIDLDTSGHSASRSIRGLVSFFIGSARRPHHPASPHGQGSGKRTGFGA